jgi:predicted PhzF superfamily epimerase YddE/YHI9
MFAAVGINGDPVRGSAIPSAARYWAERSGAASGGPMKVRAASSRGGDVELVWEKSTKYSQEPVDNCGWRQGERFIFDPGIDMPASHRVY